jgi:hypothetical protein
MMITGTTPTMIVRRETDITPSDAADRHPEVYHEMTTIGPPLFECIGMAETEGRARRNARQSIRRKWRRLQKSSE